MQSARKDITYYAGKEFPYPNEEFSAAICIETLEHVSDPSQMLSEIFRVLISGDTLLLTVPWSARRHHIPFDYFRFTPESLSNLLAEAGFVDIEISPRGSEAHVIANKLLIFIIGNLLAKKNPTYVFKLISTVFIFPMCVFWLLMAWINQMSGVQSDLDPLGWFVKVKKP